MSLGMDGGEMPAMLPLPCLAGIKNCGRNAANVQTAVPLFGMLSDVIPVRWNYSGWYRFRLALKSSQRALISTFIRCLVS